MSLTRFGGGVANQVWITKECTDVSAEVCAVLHAETDPLRRANAARDCTQRIATEAQVAVGGDGVRCDVKEMMPNHTYVLFTYERLLDVRIVYVPPKSLGNFGGDEDNFEWPRYALLSDRALCPMNEDWLSYHCVHASACGGCCTGTNCTRSVCTPVRVFGVEPIGTRLISHCCERTPPPMALLRRTHPTMCRTLPDRHFK